MTRDARIGAGFLATLAVLAIAGPLIAPDPRAQPDLINGLLLPPSAQHWFGTDQLSRDVFARFAHGARVSLLVAVVAVSVAGALGTAIGLAAGGSRGVLAEMFRRVIDIGLALPRVVVLLVLLAASGVLPVPLFAVLLGATGWPTIARLVRGEALRLQQMAFVSAARALGATPGRVLVRELFPGTLPAVLVASTLGVADAVLLEAGLSFLGLGVRPPWPSWGGMLLDARDHLATAPWLLLAPAVALVVATAGATLLGESLRRFLQPDTP